jgi:hypothetical protein
VFFLYELPLFFFLSLCSLSVQFCASMFSERIFCLLFSGFHCLIIILVFMIVNMVVIGVWFKSKHICLTSS